MTEAPKKEGWRDVTLGEIFEISSSKRVLEEQWQTGGVPFYRAREIVKLAKTGVVENELFISEELFDEYQKKYGVPAPGDLMVSAVGTLGACYVVQPQDRFYYKDASVLRFSPKETVHSKFIQYAFGTNQILDQIHRGSGSTVGTFTIERANKTRMTLPPLAEQRRIAEILDKADELRAKRRAAIAKLDSLTQSIFLDMFGDPARNPKKFPIAKMGDVCDVRDGTHDSPKHVSDGGFPLVTSRNVTGGIVDLTTVNYISEADYVQINKRSKVDRGDIILPMIGTIGSPVLVDHDPRYAIKNVALIKFIKGSPSAVFVHHLLSGHYFDHIVGQKNRGGTQKFVSLGDLRAFPLPLPPRQEQDEFTRRVGAISRIRLSNRLSGGLLNNLFASLQHRAFRGEL